MLLPKTKTYFFANDHTIRKSFKNTEMFTPNICICIWIAITLIIFTFTEIYQKKNIKQTFLNVSYTILNLAAGAVVTYAITLILKSIVRQLRPDFIDLCGINLSSIKQHYISEINLHLQITNYTCINSAALENYDELIEDGYMAFVSGHASISSYVAEYLCLYLDFYILSYLAATKNMRCSISVYFLTVFTQILLFTLALCIAFSRLSDNRHHIENIIIGLTLGYVIAKESFKFHCTSGIRFIRYF